MSEEDKYRASADASLGSVHAAGYAIELLMYAGGAVVGGAVLAWAFVGFGAVLLLSPLAIIGLEYARRKAAARRAGT